VGAILNFAVEFDLAGIDINVIGIILMIAGILGLVIAFFLYFNESSGDDKVVREQETVRRERQ
jgi:hypothetical protein